MNSDLLDALFTDELGAELNVIEMDCQSDADTASMHYAVRAALIIADTTGSALVRQDKPIKDWIEATFADSKIFNAGDVFELIIEPRIDQINAFAQQNNRRKFIWSKFQEAADDLPSRSLLISPCGSGKTLAAWRWLAAQAETGLRHAIFLYPTRATATEGFRDYVSWAPEADASLMHGSAAYELQGMFANPQSEPGEETDRRANASYVPIEAAALRSISFWDKRFYSATVDQFLAFLQWDYSALCMLPVLADSAIVVDEVHSFDDCMFASLVSMLERMNVRILCMTATLPHYRREVLSKHLHVLDAFEGEFPDLRQVDSEPRYLVRRTSREQAVLDAVALYRNGAKVLWVVNTVDRAQKLFRELQESGIDSGLHCYHSRFRLDDRKQQHSKVVAAFLTDNRAPAFAITTQVCEMGLDLDADVLVTEECPPSSLVQRMGRVNRAMNPRESSGQVFVYKPESELPYHENDLTGLTEFLDGADTDTRVSQNQINHLMLGLSERNEDRQSLCSFFRGGHITVGSYRDIQETTKPAVLDNDDLEEIRIAVNSKKPIDGFIVPVPSNVKCEAAPNWLPRWLSAASHTHYDSGVGFQKERTDQSIQDRVITAESIELEEQQWMIL